MLDGRRFRCIHLQVRNFVGLPGATFCNKYKERKNGMSIVLYDVARTGHAIESTCGSGSDEEDQAIIERGLNKGCSLMRR